MSRFGIGISYSKICSILKEEIKHAFNNEKIIGENDNGFIWGKCTDEESKKIILNNFDDVVYHCLNSMASVRTIEKIAKEKGADFSIIDYVEMLEKVKNEFPNEYDYESDSEVE